MRNLRDDLISMLIDIDEVRDQCIYKELGFETFSVYCKKIQQCWDTVKELYEFLDIISSENTKYRGVSIDHHD